MSCCDSWHLESGEKPDGICPDCGGETLYGQAVEGCNYSPVICETCGDAPCDGSC